MVTSASMPSCRLSAWAEASSQECSRRCVCRRNPYAGNVFSTPLLAFLGGSAGMHEEHAASERLVADGIDQLMSQHGQLVFFERQRRSGSAAPLLFLREIAGLRPGKPIGVLLEQGLIVLPLARAEGVVLVLEEPGQVLGRARAALGDQQETVGQVQELSQKLILLFDTGRTVAVAVEEMTGHWHRPEIVDHGGEAELEHLVLGEITTCDVRWGDA